VSQSCWLGFALIVNDQANFSRSQLLKELELVGIEYRPIVGGNVTKNSFLRFANYSIPFNVANAEIIEKNGLFIGNHGRDISSALNKVKDIVDSLR
ncbi:MAG: pyridoxamine 5-phosphate oxidase, partial [Chloroflexota bacterium]|nr:pyridoxamine 5-phosphate oxidase [Chloroflexota bacterium]